MLWVNPIIIAFNWLASQCWAIYVLTYTWGGVFGLLARGFWYVAWASNQIAWGFYYLGSFLNYLYYKVSQLFDWNVIWSNILSYIPNLLQIRDWFYNWWSNVWNVVKEWWSVVWRDVWGWIEIAKQWAGAQINQLNSLLSSLQSEWTNFKVSILPFLPNWLGIDDLIRSWFTNFTPFWEGWQDLRKQVAEFFTDPLGWLEDKFTNWFLGAE